jgi:hypothetical protein
MSARVPVTFSQPSRLGIASGKPVRGAHMVGIGDATNYLLGRGTVLLPATHPEGSSIAAAATATYHVELWEKVQAKHRVWHLRPIVSPSTGGWAQGTFTDPSGGTSVFDVLETDAERRVSVTGFFHVETIATRANGPTPVTFTLANDAASTGDIILQAVSCFELPRSELALDTTDVGADTDTMRADLPIFDGDNQSIGGLSRAIASAQAYDPRVLFAYLRKSGNGIDYKSGTQAEIFSKGPVIQPSHQYRGETVRTVYAYVYAYCDVGTAGTIKFLAASGDSVTINIVATTGTWVSGEFDVYAEDLSTADGRRSSTTEVVAILAQRTSGAGSIYIETIQLAESRLP